MRVLPVPGGPNNSRPLGGPRKPVKISLQQKTRFLRGPYSQLDITTKYCNHTL